MKKIALLGSTGSIGVQTLEVCENNKDKFELVALTANKNYNLLIQQAIKFLPKYVVIADETHYKTVKEALSGYPIKVAGGYNAMLELLESEDFDFVIVALVGYSGMLPTYKTLQQKKQLALANKESLVVAGEIIMQKAHENGITVLPIDSEHSAVFQSLVGENYTNIEKIYLTASGGPFRDFTTQQLENVTVEQALKHPNWSMGGKITIDSATMINKGLEMIEAKWLFDLKPEQIDVIVHKQSVIHSIVQFVDGSMKAQMGLPDMRFPIQYAMTYPERVYSVFKRFSFTDYPELTFKKPDESVFTALRIAKYALNKGGNIPCIMNAANEVAVQNFLERKINFLQIPQIIDKTIEKFDFKTNLTINDYVQLDTEARKIANKFVKE